MIKLDIRNKICPYPVIETKKCLKSLAKPEAIEILVDNLIATQNLEKLATELGLINVFKIEKFDDTNFKVTFNESLEIKENSSNTFVTKNSQKSIIVISSDCMGNGDEELSKKLMEGFIYSLTEQDEEIMPTKIIFYNKGVLLTTLNTKTVEDLLVIKNKGVEIMSCGLCLDFYNVKDQLKVGEITNMYNISKLLLSNNVININ